MSDPRERLIQFKTNIDVVMSVLDRNGLGDWLADRLVAIGDTVKDDLPLRIDAHRDPFLDERLRVAAASRGAAKGDGAQSRFRRREAGGHHALPQARRDGRARAAASRKSSSG